MNVNANVMMPNLRRKDSMLVLQKINFLTARQIRDRIRFLQKNNGRNLRKRIVRQENGKKTKKEYLEAFLTSLLHMKQLKGKEFWVTKMKGTHPEVVLKNLQGLTVHDYQESGFVLEMEDQSTT